MSSIEPASPDADVEVEDRATRRKSGRVTRKPQTIYDASSPVTGATKRKRGADRDEDDAQEDASEQDDSDDESTEGEPDEEELREKRRKKQQQRKTRPQKKPTAKKTKTTNGEPVSLAIRPAGKPKKARKPRPSKVVAAEEEGGLYAEVFAHAEDLTKPAAEWLQRFQAGEESESVMDLINFVLKSAGCDLKVDVHDIEDPDSCANKLSDIQEEYQAQNITEYPLIAKGKGTANFRHNLVAFFTCLIQTIAETDVLFDKPELIENIEVWVSTMSSAGNRPFRHTATVISLTVISALCEVGKNIVDTNAKIIRQSETEARKKTANKGRVADLQKKSKQAGQRQEMLDTMIKDWFDTVFVHRYRDVDPKIRVDCVQALADWIITYPDLFFDGNHLRYLGWVLSDTSGPTRLEVVKQLQKLYKDPDKLGGLKTFTEKFRSRIVEMATQDAEANVRATAVELLDICREAGLLEPDDIDSVGRLIFDAEPRVRKAVVSFFAETVNEYHDEKIEDIGGQEALDEALVTHEVDDDYSRPRVKWLKLKCLVELLQSYDDRDEDLPNQIERGPAVNSYMLVTAGLESRFSVAAQALYEAIPEIKEWEILAGYLLFDHSETASGTEQNGTSEDPETALKQACKLTEKEEIILLDILNAAVKLRLTHALESRHTKGKKSRTEREQEEEADETAARHLAALIPRLLNKFGAVPDAASAVLRLEHVLNLDVFQELRQDSTTYSDFLDDINRQFLSHGNEAVLVEASRALLHAKSYEELGEITEGKVQELWEDTINALHTLKRGKGLTARGNLSENVLTVISNTVLRISQLASISDCTEPLEILHNVTKQKSKAKSQEKINAVDILTELINRGVPASDTEPELEELEDAIVINSAKSLLFYFMWKVRAWDAAITSGAGIPDDDVEAVAVRRDAFVAGLEAVLKARHGADNLRLAVAGALLDLSVLFTTLRQAKPPATTNGNGATEVKDDYMALLLEVDPNTQELLIQLLAAAEKAFAKKSHRILDVADNDEPLDVDDEPESSDDEEAAEDEATRVQKQQEALLAEQKLCELAGKLVLAIIAGVVDGNAVDGGEGPVRQRLERNKTRLGSNYKEVVTYLDAGALHKKGKGAKSSGPGGASSKGKASHKSAEIILDDDDEEEDHEEEPEHGDEEDLRRRELVVDEDEEMRDDGENEDQNAADEHGGGDEESVLGD